MASEAERAMPPRAQVCYDDLLMDAKPVDPMEEARKAAKKRAERFGTDYHEPNKKVVLSRTDLAKMRSKRDGFATGFDMTSEAEKAKREARAAKFGATLLALTPEAAEAALQAKLEETEKQEAIDKRIERFGKVDAPAAAQGMQLDLLEARQDAARDAEARMEAIVLYGVDTLSTKDCMEYFQEFGPSFVEWIDDSSLVVVFEDEFTARRVIHGMGTPLTSDAPRPDTVPAELGRLFCWHTSSTPLVKAGVTLNLQFRVATTADVKPHGRTKSRFLWKKDKAAAAKIVTKKAHVAPTTLGAPAKRNKRVRDEGDAAAQADDTTAMLDAPVVVEQGDLRNRLKASDSNAARENLKREKLGLQLAANLRGVLDEEGLVPDFGGDSEEEDYEM